MARHTTRLPALLLTGAALGALVALGACATLRQGPSGNARVPEPAKAVELERYLGRWYELARYEQSFQKDCEAVTADYSLRADGLIRVVNSCREGAVDGPLKQAEARAKVMSDSGNAKLKVSFFGPFYVGNYWVLDHAEDYSWAIVGEGSGRYLWLLSREPEPELAVRQRLWSRTEELGYDLSMLRVTRH